MSFPKIILLAGRKQAGKSSASKFLKTELLRQSPTNMFFSDDIRNYSFGNALKDFCIENEWITYEQAYGTNEQKNSDSALEWPSDSPFEGKMTAREALQFIGTDVLRSIDPDIWLKKCLKKIAKDRVDVAIVDDCRFINEVYKIKDNEGIVILLQRDLYNDSHSSETELENLPTSEFDFVIKNQDFTEKQLHDEIKKITKEIIDKWK